MNNEAQIWILNIGPGSEIEFEYINMEFNPEILKDNWNLVLKLLWFSQKMESGAKQVIFTNFLKIWGVHRCPPLLLSRLKAEFSGKDNTPNFENAPVSRSELGVEELF